MQKQNSFSRLKLAAWAGILFFILTTLRLIFIALTGAQFSPNLNSLLLLLTLISGIVFSYGFVEMGRLARNRLLEITSWVMVALLFAALLAFLFLPILTKEISSVSAQSNAPTEQAAANPLSNVDASKIQQARQQALEEALTNSFGTILKGLFLMWIVLSLLLGVYYIVFGIALLNLNEDRGLAITTGILEIVSGSTLIIFLGFLIKPVANLFEIALLFRYHKRFYESERKEQLLKGPRQTKSARKRSRKSAHKH
ncbi:hypothetical protein D6817_03215 [Candidatus Pacearchaeota archaeon]|nr:MAG: hypothetical protein D6817_03215 [Candidatus Pacearchaeota archaeon]